MARDGAAFICQTCGAVHSKWAGQCTACGAWNSLVEERTSGPPGALAPLAGASAPGGRLETSSTMVFQPLQAVHWPDHLAATAPHD